MTLNGNNLNFICDFMTFVLINFWFIDFVLWFNVSALKMFKIKGWVYELHLNRGACSSKIQWTEKWLCKHISDTST